MTADTRLKRFATRAVALTVLSAVSFGASAVVTHHYNKDDPDELDYQAQEQQAGNEDLQGPKISTLADPESQDADDSPRTQQPSSDYVYVPKVGPVKLNTS